MFAEGLSMISIGVTGNAERIWWREDMWEVKSAFVLGEGGFTEEGAKV